MQLKAVGESLYMTRITLRTRLANVHETDQAIITLNSNREIAYRIPSAFVGNAYLSVQGYWIAS